MDRSSAPMSVPFLPHPTPPHLLEIQYPIYRLPRSILLTTLTSKHYPLSAVSYCLECRLRRPPLYRAWEKTGRRRYGGMMMAVIQWLMADTVGLTVACPPPLPDLRWLPIGLSLSCGEEIAGEVIAVLQRLEPAHETVIPQFLPHIDPIRPGPPRV